MEEPVFVNAAWTWSVVQCMLANLVLVDIGKNGVPLAVGESGWWVSEPVKHVAVDFVIVHLEQVPVW